MIPWWNYHDGDMVCNQSSRDSKWRMRYCVGDCEALCSEESNEPLHSENNIGVHVRFLPSTKEIKVIWWVDEKEGEVEEEEIKVKVRWLYPSSDFDEKKCPTEKAATVYSTDHIDEALFESILGPIHLSFDMDECRSGEYSSVPSALVGSLYCHQLCFILNLEEMIRNNQHMRSKTMCQIFTSNVLDSGPFMENI